MLDERQVKDIERKLNDLADDYYDTRNREVKERHRGYLQGIAFVLGKLGYSVLWNDGVATVEYDG